MSIHLRQFLTNNIQQELATNEHLIYDCEVLLALSVRVFIVGRWSTSKVFLVKSRRFNELTPCLLPWDINSNNSLTNLSKGTQTEIGHCMIIFYNRSIIPYCKSVYPNGAYLGHTRCILAIQCLFTSSCVCLGNVKRCKTNVVCNHALWFLVCKFLNSNHSENGHRLNISSYLKHTSNLTKLELEFIFRIFFKVMSYQIEK